MRTDLIEIPVGTLTYRAEEPHQRDGLRVTISVTNAAGIPYSDRINLDRAKARRQYAETAGVHEADLVAVRERILEWLAPPNLVDGDVGTEDDEINAEAGLAILDGDDLLDRVGSTVSAMGYAGDLWMPQLIFLVIVSRLLKRPLNLVVVGPSAAGKSFSVMLVARLFPADATYALNGMSERVLVYTDADLRHRVLIIGEASALSHDGIGASLLRSIAWEGEVRYELVEKTADGLKARVIEKPGPTGFITTTTKRVEPELETRTLTIHVPDTEQATRVILLATAKRANGDAPIDPNLAPWHAAQHWLATNGERDVTIPFSRALAEKVPADQVRARRDFTQLLTLIEAHALLHQRQRRRDDYDRIVADERDYQAVYNLALPIFGAIAAEGVTPIVRETVRAVELLVPTGADPTTVLKVAEQLGVHKSVASRRVTTSIKGGWLINDEEKRGRPFKLRLGDPLPEERVALPSPDVLFPIPLPSNPATVQPEGEISHGDAETAGCKSGYTVARPAGTVQPVAERLQSPMQPLLARLKATNEPQLHSCAVEAVEEEEQFVGESDGEEEDDLTFFDRPHPNPDDDDLLSEPTVCCLCGGTLPVGNTYLCPGCAEKESDR